MKWLASPDLHFWMSFTAELHLDAGRIMAQSPTHSWQVTYGSLNPFTKKSHERHGLSSYRQLDSVFNRLFQLTTKETNIFIALPSLFEENLPVDFHHKGSVMRKAYIYTLYIWRHQSTCARLHGVGATSGWRAIVRWRPGWRLNFAKWNTVRRKCHRLHRLLEDSGCP